jgi:hypothetical protein
MKKNKIFDVPICISQEEAALLLRVTRSQLAMFSLGQRALPIESRSKFEVLVSNVREASEAKREKLAQEEVQENERLQVIENLLRDNQLKQMRLQSKKAQMEEKFQAALNTLRFVAAMQRNKTQFHVSESLLHVWKTRANALLKKNNLAVQEVYKIRIKVLQYEKKLLEKRKQKLQ